MLNSSKLISFNKTNTFLSIPFCIIEMDARPQKIQKYTLYYLTLLLKGFPQKYSYQYQLIIQGQNIALCLLNTSLLCYLSVNQKIIMSMYDCLDTIMNNVLIQSLNEKYSNISRCQLKVIICNHCQQQFMTLLRTVGESYCGFSIS